MRMARTLSGKTPEQVQREQEILMQRAADKFQRRFAVEISRTMRRVGALLLAGDDLGAELETQEHAKRIERLLTALYRDTIGQSVEQLADTAKSRWLALEKKEVQVIGTPNVDAIMLDWLRLYGGVKITQISLTTLDDVRSAISSGIEQGMTEREIGKLIAAVAIEKSPSRAQTIARTESHQATNVAAQSVAKASGIPMRKQWSASKGERTRQAHREADGQTVPMDGFFTVWGEQLAFPGDPRGSAKNVINCRCVVVYVI